MLKRWLPHCSLLHAALCSLIGALSTLSVADRPLSHALELIQHGQPRSFVAPRCSRTTSQQMCERGVPSRLVSVATAPGCGGREEEAATERGACAARR
jgi:hypothetical protein